MNDRTQPVDGAGTDEDVDEDAEEEEKPAGSGIGGRRTGRNVATPRKKEGD